MTLHIDRCHTPMLTQTPSTARALGIFLNVALVCSSFEAVVEAQEKLPVSEAPIRDEGRKFAKRVTSWKALKQRNIVMQNRDYSCGAAALATITNYYWGDDHSEEFFLVAIASILTDEEMKDRVENGLAMSDLRRVAVKTGYQAVVGRLTFEKLMEAKVPLIVGISVEDYDHFVVYRGFDGYYVYMADPIRGNIRIPACTFIEQWQENAVLAVHKPGEKVKKVSPLSVREDEIRLGELNWQLIRTQATRIPPTPPPNLRP